MNGAVVSGCVQVGDCLSDFLTLLCTLQVNTITLESSELLARGVRELQWCGGVLCGWCEWVPCWCGECHPSVGVVGAAMV